MGGEYYYAVESKVYLDIPRGLKRVLRVAYLMAYYWDCGAASSYEWHEWFDNPHSGDSEFIIVDVAYDTVSHHWETFNVFLSAHCGSPWIPPWEDHHCRWHAPSDFAYWVNQRVLGAPYVWASRAKHANYPTENSCDEAITVGGAELEDCEYDTPQRFPVVYVQQNIGSRSAPFVDCAAPFSASAMPDVGSYECMWSFSLEGGPPLGRFNGWQSETVGGGGLPPAPYGRILQDYGGFW
jgi:hypothetical protein